MTVEQIKMDVKNQKLTKEILADRLQHIDFCYSDRPCLDPVKESKRQHMMRVRQAYQEILNG